MRIDQAATCLAHFLDADVPVFLWGSPGVGKSDVVRQVAAARGASIVDFRAVLRDPVDLRGIPAPDMKRGVTRWLVPDELPREDRDGKTGILFLDELNAAPIAVQAACFGLVLDRKLGDYVLPSGWRIIAAGNRTSDRAAAQRMPSALANRLAHLDIEPDVAAWAAWAAGAGIHPALLAFVRFRPALLHSMDSTSGELRSFPTPRAWASVSRIVEAVRKAPADLAAAMVAALVGDGAAAEFVGFLRLFDRIPSIDRILQDPTGAPLPDANEPGIMYALAAALSRKATVKTFAAVVTYISRMPAEFGVLTVVDSVKRDPQLCETAAFVAWASRNRDVVL